MPGSRGGNRGSRPPTPPPPTLKNHKVIGLLINTGPDPLKTDKATKPELSMGMIWARGGGQGFQTTLENHNCYIGFQEYLLPLEKCLNFCHLIGLDKNFRICPTSKSPLVSKKLKCFCARVLDLGKEKKHLGAKRAL